MRKIAIILMASGLMALTSGCSASKKAFEKAKEYEAAGLYVEAARQDIQALDKKPDFTEARAHLKEIAPKAYREMLSRCENLESAKNWDQAVAEYKSLELLLNDFYRHGVVLETVNVNERLNEAKQKAAAQNYVEAEALYAKAKWQRAAEAYLLAHRYVDNYNGAFGKSLESFLNLGNEHLQHREFKRALNAYQKVAELAPGHPEVVPRIMETHYQFGKHYFEIGEYRKALAEFEIVENHNEEYKDVAMWADRAFDHAVQYVAVFPFGNETNVPIDGFFLAVEILSQVQPLELRFADFLPQPDLVALLSDYKMLRQGWVSEANLFEVANQEELDSFVWGTIKEAAVKDSPESFTEFEHQKTVVVQDSAGNDVEKNEPIYFREYKRVRRVELLVQYVIVDVATGKYLERQRIAEEAADQARWIAYQGSIYDLPRDKRPLLDAPRDPRPVEVMIEDLLRSIGRRIARDVERFYR